MIFTQRLSLPRKQAIWNGGWKVTTMSAVSANQFATVKLAVVLVNLNVRTVKRGRAWLNHN